RSRVAGDRAAVQQAVLGGMGERPVLHPVPDRKPAFPQIGPGGFSLGLPGRLGHHPPFHTDRTPPACQNGVRDLGWYLGLQERLSALASFPYKTAAVAAA